MNWVCAYLKQMQTEFWRGDFLAHVDFDEQEEYGAYAYNQIVP
jgi:hypothetical protein